MKGKTRRNKVTEDEVDGLQYGNLVCEMYYPFDINGNIKYVKSIYL